MFNRILYLLILANLSLLFSCKNDKKIDVISKNYELIWADEFNYTGKLDATKWGYEYGFIRNN
ncbi:MAG: hypothetical protein KAT78_02680, partial [Flavobacteriaceae bacterium]|nr:hypothetical protein [Flavobacteriaceae bacterium]